MSEAGRAVDAVVVMGVSGAGKTSVGRRLASELGFDYVDADDYHPAANVAKMSAGIPLSDDDRAPWLAALRRLIEARARQGRSLVLGCSALKAGYRRVLAGTAATAPPGAASSPAGLAAPGGAPAARVTFVYLKGDYDTILARMKRRRRHFMRADMLRSQFRDLEEPEDAVTVEVAGGVPATARQALAGLAARGVGRARAPLRPDPSDPDEEESA